MIKMFPKIRGNSQRIEYDVRAVRRLDELSDTEIEKGFTLSTFDSEIKIWIKDWVYAPTFLRIYTT